jgi:integrase/recombinase XerD
MANKHAKTLDDTTLTKLLAQVAGGEHGLRDQAMILLSFKAGLRAQEIAGLDWSDVSDANGSVRTDSIFVPSRIAKNGRERTVPMHPHLHVVLSMLRSLRPNDKAIAYGTVRGLPRLSPVSVRVWFHRLFEKHNLEGCSSHSGRRTFITKLARSANLHDCSIRDVQKLAGHAELKTTEQYIDLSANVGRLVCAI